MRRTELVSFHQLSEEQEILQTMFLCRDAFFDQSVAHLDIIEGLAHKFAEHAIVLRTEIDGQITGFVAFYANDTVSRTGFISMIIVRREFQGQGIGTLLLDHAVFKLTSIGFSRLRLEVRRDNRTALRFYQKYGFVFEKEASPLSDYYVLNIQGSPR